MKPSPPAPFDQSVFINCPFDPGWKDNFYAISFTVLLCGFTPRCARERDNSDDVRISKIMDIIAECQYGIHDLSELNARLNMPLELGLFMGCKRYGPRRKHDAKSYLIFEGKDHSIKTALSDLAGQDVKTHNGLVENILQGVRDWLDDKIDPRVNPTIIPSGTFLKDDYDAFRAALPGLCKRDRLTVDTLKFKDFLSYAEPWIKTVIYPKSSRRS